MTGGDDLRALSAAATPGPWAPWGEPGSYVHVWTSDERIVTRDVLSTDAELIVWLRNHADALADLIDAARGLLEALEPINPMVLGTGACAAYNYTAHLLDALEADQ